ncbi:MAG TPA: SagB/ThcOx family dehydrogenase [Candidatus Paceibacterota bacterium]|nr:SagB/ThcOx family dehydrogenase [Candidatus Paceibacterota bacterium]
MQQFVLPRTELQTPLSQALRHRRSFLELRNEGPLSTDDLGAVFSGLRRHDGSVRRRYPSGGALFPIETYIVSRGIEGAGSGVFHYHPTEHALERLWDVPTDFSMSDLVRAPEAPAASSIVLFTSVWERSSAKYGDFAYMLALLEAGHLSENILLAASACEIGARPVIGFSDEVALSLLDIDERLEQPVLSIILCRGEDTRSSLQEVHD